MVGAEEVSAEPALRRALEWPWWRGGYTGLMVAAQFQFEATKRTGNVSLLRRLLPHAAARETGPHPLGIAPIVIGQ